MDALAAGGSDPASRSPHHVRGTYRLVVAVFVAVWVVAACSWAWLNLPRGGEFTHLQVSLTGAPGVRHQVSHSGTTTFSERDSHFVTASPTGVADLRLRLPSPASHFIRIDAGSEQPVRACRLDAGTGAEAVRGGRRSQWVLIAVIPPLMTLPLLQGLLSVAVRYYPI